MAMSIFSLLFAPFCQHPNTWVDLGSTGEVGVGSFKKGGGCRS